MLFSLVKKYIDERCSRYYHHLGRGLERVQENDRLAEARDFEKDLVEELYGANAESWEIDLRHELELVLLWVGREAG